MSEFILLYSITVCPLYLTSLEVAEKIESLSKEEREFLCSLLFHAVNWFREVSIASEDAVFHSADTLLINRPDVCLIIIIFPNV